MKIHDAIIVTIDFDGDIYFRDTGTFVFAGHGAMAEARQLVKDALITMKNYEKKRRSKNNDFDNDASVDSIDEKSLDDFIEQGGDFFGNWEITIVILGKQK